MFRERNEFLEADSVSLGRCQHYQSCLGDLNKYVVTSFELKVQSIIIKISVLGCVKPIGVSNGRIKDSQLTASSSNGKATPNLGRLNRGPIGNETHSHWQPLSSDKNPYIQVNFNEERKITAIETQGHFQPQSTEFATSYIVYYLLNGNWIRHKVMCSSCTLKI